MANKDKENKIKKFTKEAIGKTLNQFNKEIGMTDLVEINKNQDRILNGILSQVNDENTEKTEKSNIITLDNSTDGIVELKEIQGDTNVNVSKIAEETPITHVIEDKEGNVISLDDITEGAINIDNIQGNTMVNCNKEPDKELVLMEDLSTQGYSNVTLTEGVDGGLVDVALEGNTMVNVCDQKDPVAITKSYTVETGNHVALQGEYDGKCRPVVTGNTLVNLIGEKINITKYKIIYLKPNTTYTLIGKCDSNTPGMWFTIKDSSDNILVNKTLSNYDNFCYALSTELEAVGDITFSVGYSSVEGTYFNGFTELMLLEGDYTNKPIPGYFEGLQSSFEDNLVTQEMVDNGEEEAENLGKYKVDYVVTGKNKFDVNKLIEACSSKSTINITTNNNNSFTLQSTSPYVSNILVDFGLDMSKQYSIKYDNPNNAFVVTQVENGFNFYVNPKYDGTIVNLQIEEGSVATPYEPYKEYTKTFYLNSPLLEGDTIEQQGNNVVHVHRYGKVVLNGVDNSGMSMYPNREFNSDNTMLKVAYTRRDIKTADGAVYDNSLCDKLYWKADITGLANDTPCYGRSTADWKLLINIPLTINSDEAINAYLQSNPLTFVLPLKAPTYELIEQSNLAIPSYVNGHLDFNTAVPVSKVNFLHFEEELTYLYANTQYILQFISDVETTVNISLGGTSLLSQSIIQGLNRISITTPSELVNSKLIMDGLGVKISEVVVTDTDREFKYFEGMTSVGENGLKIYSGKPRRFGKGGRI